MPLVEKTTGSRVRVRGIGEFTVGDRAEVSSEEASYLCEERGDFERVNVTDVEHRDVDDTADEEDEAAESDDEGESEEPTAEDSIEDGECPWCEDYSGDGVPQHAASAHPDEWDAYKQEH